MDKLSSGGYDGDSYTWTVIQNVLSKYDVALSERECVLVMAAFSSGMSDAYSKYRDAISCENPDMVGDLLSEITEKINIAKEEMSCEFGRPNESSSNFGSSKGSSY